MCCAVVNVAAWRQQGSSPTCLQQANFQWWICGFKWTRRSDRRQSHSVSAWSVFWTQYGLVWIQSTQSLQNPSISCIFRCCRRLENELTCFLLPAFCTKAGCDVTTVSHAQPCFVTTWWTVLAQACENWPISWDWAFFGRGGLKEREIEVLQRWIAWEQICFFDLTWKHVNVF